MMRLSTKWEQDRRLLGALLGVSALLVSCGPAAPSLNLLGATQSGPIEVYPGAQQAFFARFPHELLAAAYMSCANPGQTARQPTPESVVCETLPSPEGAAALILAHNGTVEDVPRLFTTIISRPSGSGYLVTGDSYVAVPQRDGGIVQLRLPETGDALQNLLTTAGGQPVAE